MQNSTIELKNILTDASGLQSNKMSLSCSKSLIQMRSPSKYFIVNDVICSGLTKTFISGELSVATNLTAEDQLTESELTETIRSDIEKWIDESKLSVMNITYAKTMPAIENTSTESGSTLDLDSFDYKGDEYDISGVIISSVGDNLEKLSLSEHSLSEKSCSCVEDVEDTLPEICIGNIFDKDIPLIYCARLILKSFLLNGRCGVYITDKSVRVSVKSLALTCLSSILKMCPRILFLYLDKNYVGAKLSNRNLVSSQPIADIFLYQDHPDPQLRGTIAVLTCSFIKAVLVRNGGNYQAWVADYCPVDDVSHFQIQVFVNILIKVSICFFQYIGWPMT